MRCLCEGDLLGLDSYVDEGVSRYSHRTCTDVILYGVDAAVFESMVARHGALQRFLAARVTVAGIVGTHRRSWLDAQAPPIDFLRARFRKHEAASTSPLTLVDATASTRDMVRAMLRDQTDRLGIGTPLEALLSADDLSLFCGQNPMALLREIRSSDSTAEVTTLLKLSARMVDAALAGAHDIDDCCRIEHEVMRALTEVCVRMATAEVAGLLPSPVVG